MKPPGAHIQGPPALFAIVLIVTISSWALATTPDGIDPGPLGRAWSTSAAVHGPSWLHRIGSQMDQTCMGQTGNWPGSTAAGHADAGNFSEAVKAGDSFLVTGVDLYRFNCAGCHTRDGSGVPPIIPSLIGPVRATSSMLFSAQMKTRGIELDPTALRDMVAQSTAALRSRLANGGERMPAFDHLQRVEVEALLIHLRRLAGEGESERHEVRLKVATLEVGQHIVLGTCHICHDATGPGRQGSLETSALLGVIPSLASLPLDRTRAEVIRKVREGLAEPAALMTRGRMPILDYLSADEVGAAYDYLSAFPPAESAPPVKGASLLRPAGR